MRAAICEDEKIFADTLTDRLTRFFEKRGGAVGFDLFADGRQLISAMRNGSRYDIIFLDIQLENSNGMDTAAELRELDRSVPVIFVTGVEDRAADGYSVNAFDYIVKSSLDDKLDRVLERFTESRSDETIAVEDLHGELNITPLREILYAESEGRHSVIHTAGGDIETALPITRLCAILPEEDFIEIHRSIYVRVAQIKSIAADTLELSDGSVLPLSRRRKKAVLSAVMRQVRNN